MADIKYYMQLVKRQNGIKMHHSIVSTNTPATRKSDCSAELNIIVLKLGKPYPVNFE